MARERRRLLRFEALEARLAQSAILAMSTSGDVTGAGSLGDQSWADSAMVEFGGSQPHLEPGITSGGLSSLFDLGDLADRDVNLGGLHYVANDISVAGTILATGAVLFTTDAAAMFNGLLVMPRDVVLFTPESRGDYRAGTFRILIDGGDIGISGGISAVSLADADVSVGGTSLAAGTFLLAGLGIHTGITSSDLVAFEPTSLGDSATAGSMSLLLDGSDLGLNRAISDIHLVSEVTTVADAVLHPGDLLMTLSGDDPSVGNNEIAVTPQDVFLLQVTRAGEETEATALLWFDGSDVNMTTSAAKIDGICLIETTPLPDEPVLIPDVPWSRLAREVCTAFAGVVNGEDPSTLPASPESRPLMSDASRVSWADSGFGWEEVRSATGGSRPSGNPSEAYDVPQDMSFPEERISDVTSESGTHDGSAVPRSVQSDNPAVQSDEPQATRERDTEQSPLQSTSTPSPEKSRVSPTLHQAVDAIVGAWIEQAMPREFTRLWQQLDEIEERTDRDTHRAAVEQMLVAGVSGGLSVGYVAWSLRRSSLLMSGLTSSPLWKDWDPLTVLEYCSRKRGRPGKRTSPEETLETIAG